MLRKGTAVFVCTAFLSASVLMPKTNAEMSSTPATAYRSLLDDMATFTLPKEIGKIQETYRGTSDKIVVLIQDAHSIPDAQRSIRSAIDHFQTQYGIATVGLEGASEKLDPQIFRSFPDKELLRKTFDAYAQRGELTGGTAAALFNTSPSTYHGIEDWPLYEEGVSYFLKATAMESEIKALLEPRVAALNQEKETVYSKELLEIDRLLASFGENKTDLAQVLNQLSKYRPPPKGSELAVLLEEIQRDQITDTPIEIKIKKIAEQVVASLKSQSSSSETRQELLEFNGKLQEFRTARTTPQAFALYLKGLVQKHKIRVKVSRTLAYLVENQKRLKDIEGTRLFEEFKRYADSVKESLFQNDQQKALDIQTRGLELINRLARLELSFEDWGKMQKLILQLDRWTVTQDGVVSRDEVSGILKKMEPHLAFYRVAEKRDQVFFKNVQSMMEKQNKASSVLVAGGFHTEGLTQTFKANGISYVLVMPWIGAIPEEPLYREHMQGQVSWSNYFEVKDGKVNLYDAFVRATRDKLLGDKNASSASGKEWRDQIIRDLAADGRITQTSQYTRFIDERTQSSSPNNQSLRDKWLANIDHFGEGLKKLQTEGNLSESSIMQLIKTITTAVAAESCALGGTTDPKLLPAFWRRLGHSEVRGSTAPAETRQEVRRKTRSESRATKTRDAVFTETDPVSNEIEQTLARLNLKGMSSRDMRQTEQKAVRDILSKHYEFYFEDADPRYIYPCWKRMVDDGVDPSKAILWVLKSRYNKYFDFFTQTMARDELARISKPYLESYVINLSHIPLEVLSADEFVVFRITEIGNSNFGSLIDVSIKDVKAHEKSDYQEKDETEQALSEFLFHEIGHFIDKNLVGQTRLRLNRIFDRALKGRNGDEILFIPHVLRFTFQKERWPVDYAEFVADFARNFILHGAELRRFIDSRQDSQIQKALQNFYQVFRDLIGREYTDADIADIRALWDKEPVADGHSISTKTTTSTDNTSLDKRSELRVSSSTTAATLAARVLEPGAVGKSLDGATMREVIKFVRMDLPAFIAALKTAVDEQMAKLSAAGVKVDRRMADKMIERIISALERSGIEGNLTIAFNVSPDKNFLEALRAVKTGIGTAVFSKTMAREMPADILKMFKTQIVSNFTSFKPLAAENTAVPVVTGNLGADYLLLNEALFGVGVNTGGIEEGEPFLEVVENVVKIAGGLLLASRLKASKDLKNPAKAAEIKAELLKILFGLDKDSNVLSIDKNGHLIVNRSSLLRQIMSEYQATSEVRKAA